jgi:hypothetical protein
MTTSKNIAAFASPPFSVAVEYMVYGLFLFTYRTDEEEK